jgi:hypothetical protein
MEAEVPLGLITNVFLYDWLRASTINANVPEPCFQTLERHWDTVVERVAAFVDTLVRWARRLVACLSCGRGARGRVPRGDHRCCP